MRYHVLALAASSLVSAQSATSSASPTRIGEVVPIGHVCVPGGIPCALGAQCYATNSGLQTVCGNFQASCTSDQQCAFNTCNQGTCNGASPSSQASASHTPIGAVVRIGDNCTPGGTMCALGAQCYATNSGLQTVCGNFGARCQMNQQCAFNTCNEGFCKGYLSSSASQASVSPTTSSSTSSLLSSVWPSTSGNATLTPTPTLTPTGTPSRSSATATVSPPIYTGAASGYNAAGGAMAMVLGALALAL